MSSNRLLGPRRFPFPPPRIYWGYQAYRSQNSTRAQGVAMDGILKPVYERSLRC